MKIPMGNNNKIDSHQVPGIIKIYRYKIKQLNMTTSLMLMLWGFPQCKLGANPVLNVLNI